MATKVHTKKPKDWDLLEQRLSQIDLFAPQQEETEVVKKPTKPKRSSQRAGRGSGFISGH